MNALIFDTETTGLTMHPHARPSLQPRVIEFAGLLIDESGTELDELVFLCNPGQLIDAVIMKITGLSNEDLIPAPPFSENVPKLRALFEKADMLVAHNLPFDHALISHELARLGLLEKWPWPRALLCTAQTYEPIWGHRPKLIELFQHVTGEEYQQTHRAMDDVRALARVVVKEDLITIASTCPQAFTGFPPTGFRDNQPGR